MGRIVFELRFIVASFFFGLAARALPRGFNSAGEFLGGFRATLKALAEADYYVTTGEQRPPNALPRTKWPTP